MNRNCSPLLLVLVALHTVASPVSPFTLISKEADYSLNYSGQGSLKGHFVALSEISEFDDSPKPEPYLVVRLEVAKESAEVLPTLSSNPSSSIWLRNTDKALDVLLSKSLAKRIKAHKILRVEGDAEITVDSLQAEATCDQWGFSAEVVAASVTPNIVARLGPDGTSRGGC